MNSEINHRLTPEQRKILKQHSIISIGERPFRRYVCKRCRTAQEDLVSAPCQTRMDVSREVLGGSDV